MSIHVSDSQFEVGLLGLASNHPSGEFTEFLELAVRCNRIGYLKDFLRRYVQMIDEGCDPASSMSYAYFDVLEDYDQSVEKN